MKKIRGDESMGVIMHTYMEISQGNSLCLPQATVSCFSFYLFSYKIGEQEGRTSPAQWGLLAPVGRGKILRKEGRRVNVYTCK
jgi:hypothetical protein